MMREFLGMSASQYRRRARRILERGGPAPVGSDTGAYWERMLAGGLSDDEARALDAYLCRLAPPEAPEESARDETEPWIRLRQTLARGFVSTLPHLIDFADRRRFARDAVCFPDDTFFERLSRQSREAEDPERAVEWALLAVDSLAANRGLESCPERAALAWARLALARWRAGDLTGAEKDLETSVAKGPLGDAVPAAWKAEIGRVTAAFHWHRGRRRQASEIAEAMVADHRTAAAGELRKALVLRAELRAASADVEAAAEARAARLHAALTDVEEARDLLAESPVAERVAAVGLWARILVLIGDHAEIAVALPQARRLASGDERAAPVLLWLEGHAGADPEPFWRQAGERFTALGDDLRVARVHLDLARLCLRKHRAREASSSSAAAAARLGALVTAPEDLAALEPLGRAATIAGKLAVEDLDRVERILKRFEWQRRSERALELAR